MKRLLYTLFLIPFVFSAFAQRSQGGQPRGWTNNEPLAVEQVSFPDQNVLALRADAEETYLNGGQYRVGIEVEQFLNGQSNGEWTTTAKGDRFWRLQIKAKDAQAIGVLFDRLFLPEGSELYAYNESRTEKLGAFTSENNTNSEWAIAPIRGESIILEYFSPAPVTKIPTLDISGISYIFRGFDATVSRTGFGDSGPCQVNVNCPEGDLYRSVQRSVVRIFTKSGPFFGFCSGALVRAASPSESCPPYVLSADHCSENTSTSDFNQWVFYFNYEGPSCANPANENGLTNESMVGCDLIANSGVGDISAGSDFLLIELDADVPTSFQPFFAGWSRAAAPSTGGVSIHHPAGDIKKISTYSQTLLTGSWPGTATPNHHWQVYWTSTSNGHGATEGGSSGAPLFNSNNEIVGVLSGGFSSCTNASSLDYYGKFSTAWASDGTANDKKLAPWLDPSGQNFMAWSGSDNQCAPMSLTESEEVGVQLFPNPVWMELSWESHNLVLNVEVMDASGRIVFSGEANDTEGKVDVRGWASGVYFISLESAENRFVKQFIVP